MLCVVCLCVCASRTIGVGGCIADKCPQSVYAKGKKSLCFLDTCLWTTVQIPYLFWIFNRFMNLCKFVMFSNLCIDNFEGFNNCFD